MSESIEITSVCIDLPRKTIPDPSTEFITVSYSRSLDFRCKELKNTTDCKGFHLDKSDIVMIVNLHVKQYLATNVKKLDGKFIKVRNKKLISPNFCIPFYISSQLLQDITEFQSYVEDTLHNSDLDETTCDYYLNFQFFRCMYDIVKAAKRELLEVDGRLIINMTKEIDETRMLENWSNKEDEMGLIGIGSRDDFSCGICLEELSQGNAAGTGILGCQTLCSHIFHRSCLLPWSMENKTCPICRRILSAT